MQKIILLSVTLCLFMGCSTIPLDSSSFGPTEVGPVHYDAEDLAFEEASYLYMGQGKENMLLLTAIDTEYYFDAFGVKKSMLAEGIYNEYVKLKPGIHDLVISSRPQGLQAGSVITFLTIDCSYEFAPGFVYILNQEDDEGINVSYGKIGSPEMFDDRIIFTK